MTYVNIKQLYKVLSIFNILRYQQSFVVKLKTSYRRQKSGLIINVNINIQITPGAESSG